MSEDELLNLIETLPSKSEGPKEKQKSKKKSHKPSPSVGPSAVKGKGEDPINLVQPNSEGISETEPIDTTLAKETVAKETVTSPKMGNSQPLNDSLTPISTPKQSGVETLLWVDKYKPVAMKQLIGQQGEKSPANKLLKWLRNWEQNHRQTGRTKKPFGKISCTILLCLRGILCLWPVQGLVVREMGHPLVPLCSPAPQGWGRLLLPIWHARSVMKFIVCN